MRIGGLLVVAAVGLGVGSGGRPPAVDMVSARIASSVPTPTHLGHWVAPVSGRAVFITGNVMEAGAGTGDVTLGVLVTGTGIVCTLVFACTATSGDMPNEDCEGAVLPALADVHLTYSHTCDTAPHGNVVFGFEWNR